MGNSVLTGKIEFIQAHKPSLDSGDYEITVTQDVTGSDIKDSSSTFGGEAKYFSVAGPRFDLPPQDIYAMFPPPGNQGDHSNVLPHIILKRSTLPWERDIWTADSAPPEGDDYTPWLALLVFHEDDIEAGRVSEPQILNLDLLKRKSGEPLGNSPHFPRFDLEVTQKLDDKVTVIDVQKELLDAILPTLQDLTYLAHVRQRKILSIDIDQSYLHSLKFSYVDTTPKNSTKIREGEEGKIKTLEEVFDASTKFKEALKQGGIRLSDACSIKCRENGSKIEWVIADASNGQQYIAREDTDTQGETVLNVFTNDAEVSVIIANRLPKPGGLTTVHLVSLEDRFRSNQFHSPRNLQSTDFIRLVSLKYWSFSCTNPNHNFKEILLHLNQDTLRLPPSSNASATDFKPYLDKGYVALHHYLRKGDKTLSWYHSPLLSYKNPERLYSLSKLQSKPTHSGWFIQAGDNGAKNYFWGDQDNTYRVTPCFGFNPRVSDQLLRIDQANGLFDTTYAAAWQLGRMLGLQNQRFSIALTNWKRSQAQQSHQTKQAATSLHLQTEEHPEQVVSSNTTPHEVSSWFDKLNQLQGVPFNYLVPNAEMLPEESIRFFQVDPLWVDCLLDGAFSLGRTTEADQTQDFQHIIASNRYPVMSGLLLRSEAVSGWPGLLIDGYYQLSTETTNSEISQITGDTDKTPFDMPNLQKDLHKIGLPLPNEFRATYAAETETCTLTDLDTNSNYVEKIVGDDNNPQICLMMPDRDRQYNYSVLKEITKESAQEVEKYYLKLPLLRIERLANDVVLCLFQGEIQRIDIHLKPETLHFGLKPPSIKEPAFSKELKQDNGEEYSAEDKEPLKLIEDYWEVSRKDADNPETKRLKISKVAEEIGNMIEKEITSAQFALQMLEGTELVRFWITN